LVDPRRNYLLIKVPLTGQVSSLTVDLTCVLDLCRVNVVPGKPTQAALPLDDQERTADLQATPTIDYNNPDFQHFLLEHDLLIKKGESRSAFAGRAFCFVADDNWDRQRRSGGVQPNDPNYIRKTSYVCRSTCTAWDCGTFGLLDVAILRANGIPSRLLPGWFTFQGGHVELDYYDPTIGGFALVDARSDGDGESSKHRYDFGMHDPNFVTFHLNTDLSPENGASIPFHQFAFDISYEGPGPWQPNFVNVWKPTRIPLPYPYPSTSMR
jgi:hypothetical protein